MATCPNGHAISDVAQFCVSCGVPTYRPQPGFGPPPGFGPLEAGYAPPYQRPATGTNGLAIAALVFGLLWLWGLGSILGLAFGLLGRKQIRERAGWQSGDGFALSGMSLGFVGVILALVLTVVVVAG